MKKIYLLSFAVCAAIAGNAQLKQSAPVAIKQAYRGLPTATPVDPAADRVTIWSNDISNCSDFVMGDAFSEGQTQYIDGLDWQCGTDGPAGPAAIDPIASPSADNGFMMVDSDLFGGETPANAWDENTWFQTAQPIDVSAYDNISLRFYTQYRMWDNGSSDGNEYCLVEISTDGVTWPDVTTYEVADAASGTRFELWPTMETQDPVVNPTIKVFNISEVAGAADQVWLRFRWRGYWGYSWMVDDIELYETPANDLTILNNWCGDIVNAFEYHAIPTTQAGETSFGAEVANYGYNDAVGATVSFLVDGNTYTATGDIPAGTVATLWTPVFNLPTTPGSYDVGVTIPDDDQLEGNVGSNFFEVTDLVYGQNSDFDLFQRTLNSDQEVAFGNLYGMVNDGQAGGIEVLLGSNTDAGILCQLFLYEVGADIQTLTEVGSSEEFVVTQALIDYCADGNYAVLGFNSSGAVDVTAGSTYIAEIRKYESSDRIYVAANELDDDFGVACYGPFGTGGASNWFNGWNFTPAVRLNMDASIENLIGVSEITAEGEISKASIYPNPADVNATIAFDLLNNNDVTVVVRDITGRMVSSEFYGNLTQGQNKITLNVNDLNAGVYSVTVMTGVSSYTGQVVVR